MIIKESFFDHKLREIFVCHIKKDDLELIRDMCTKERTNLLKTFSTDIYRGKLNNIIRTIQYNLNKL